VRFAAALTLTHNATSLILPGAANITTAAGDVGIFTSDGSGNWRCINYETAAGTFRRYYESSQQSITSGGALTLAHGLSTVPKFVWAKVIAVAGGATYFVSGHHSTAAHDNIGWRIQVDATSLYIRFGAGASVLWLLDGAGSAQNLANADYRIIFGAAA
jgi:hypothetical protein